MKRKIGKVAMLLVLFIASGLLAVPVTLNFQGALKDADGIPVDDTRYIDFRIYDDPDAGTLLWSEDHSTVIISDGIFSEELGGTEPFPADFFENDVLYITFFIGGEEMTPRQKLLSVPYALQTENSETIEDVPLSGLVQQDGSGNSEITGTMTATTFVGDGSGLTGISGGSADNLGNHTATTDLNMASFKITNLNTPTADGDAATKLYVDNSGDNLGNHTATENVKLNEKWLSNDGGDEGVFVTTDGDVGIGKTNPSTKLDVDGNVTATAFVGDGSGLTGISGGSSDNLGNHTATENIRLSNNWLSNDGGDEGVYVTTDGDVGIGKTNPSTKLDVNGTVTATSFAGDGSNLTGISGDNLGNHVATDSLDMTNHRILNLQYPMYYNDAATRQYVDDNSSGDNLGNHSATSNLNMTNHKITNLTTPTASYDAATKLYVDNNGDDLGNHTATQNVKLNNKWLSNDGGNEGVYVATAGNVGIGTTSPAEKLHVAGDIRLNAGGDITFTDDNTRIHETSDDLYIEADDDLYLSPDDDIQLPGSGIWKYEGNVGIGTTNPSEKLEVNGKIEVEDGIKVNTATNDGIYVYKAGTTATFLNSVNNNGIEVAAAQGSGFFAGYCGSDGVYIHRAGNPTTQYPSSEINGIEVAGAQGNGLYIGQADGDGIHVKKAGNPTTTVSNGGSNGIEIEGALHAGVYVGHSDETGVSINYAGSNGIFINETGLNGISIYNASYNGYAVSIAGGDGFTVNTCGDDGLSVNNAGDDGVMVYNATNRAFYGITNDANHEWGLYTPDKISAYNYAGRGFSTYALNTGTSSLEPGDIVCIAGGLEENVLDGEGYPIVHIEKANQSNTQAVFGVVEYRVSVLEKWGDVPEGETMELRKSFKHADGNVGSGDFLSVIVFGQADVKVSSRVDLSAGETLTASEGGARNIRTTEINGITVAENVGILGKALENSNGRGTIKVFVNCR